MTNKKQINQTMRTLRRLGIKDIGMGKKCAKLLVNGDIFELIYVLEQNGFEVLYDEEYLLYQIILPNKQDYFCTYLLSPIELKDRKLIKRLIKKDLK